MGKIQDYKYRLIAAALLGVLALGCNLGFSSLVSNSWIAPGYLLLFMASQALGLVGAAVALSSGMLPYSLLQAEYLEALRAITMCFAIAMAVKYRFKAPCYLVVFSCWLVVLGPVFISLRTQSSIFTNLPLYHFAVLAWSDTLLALSASVILLRASIWTKLTNSPRYTSGDQIMRLILALLLNATIVVTLFAGGTISGLSWETLSISTQSNENILLGLMLLGLTLPLIATKHCSAWLNKIALLQSPAQVNAQRSKSFSGLASDHWRRQQSNDVSEIISPQANTGANKEPSASIQPTRSLAVCAINQEGVIEFANRMFFKLCLIEDQGIIGRDIRSIGLQHEICLNILSLAERTLSHGNQLREIKVNFKPQSFRFLELSSQASKPGQESDSAAKSIIITMRDITERRTIESHLLRAQKLGSLGSLVRHIAHDFNNALTSIIGYCGASTELKSKPLDDKKLIAQIHNAANAAAFEIKQLLEFAEDSPALMRPANLSEMVKQRLCLIKKLVGEEIEIKFSDSSQPLTVKLDPNLLMQALTNLVMNSKEALNGRGVIEISLDSENIDEVVSNLHIGAKPGNFARLKVKDSGAGMNRDVLARAFEPLFSTKAQTGHTGLGLSIVYAIVRSHDGFLTAESHPGKGTNISLYLPFDTSSQTEQLEFTSDVKLNSELSEPALNLEQMRGKERILVVEDEASVRDLLNTILSSLGYKVTLCSDGPQALEVANSQNFDLILCDLILPKINGSELINILRQNNSDLKALIISGYGSMDKVTNNATRSLSKPFEISELARELRSLLDQSGVETTT